MKKTAESDYFLQAKRAITLLKRRYQKKRAHEKRRAIKRRAKLKEGMRSVSSLKKHIHFLKVFSNYANLRRPLKIKNRDTNYIALPSTFSLLDNAEESLIAIAKIIKALRVGKDDIQLDHSQESRTDYAAHALLASSVEVIRKFGRALGHHPRRISGTYPNSAGIRRLMNSAGIVDAIRENRSRKPKNNEEIILFKEKSVDEETTFGSVDSKTRSSERLQKQINECLSLVNLQLTTEAEGLLGQYVGEILCNCEDHSGENLWTFSAYLDTKNRPYYCDIVIFNFGLTYGQTFAHLSKTHLARTEVAPYVERHLGTNGLTEENLFTVIALQELISSQNHTEADTRGCGTVDFIEFFQSVSAECAGPAQSECKMALISGRTHILFDGKYKMAQNVLANNRKTIAFNTDNDLQQPPDHKVVTHMRAISFPGTIISIRFPMEPATEKEGQ